MNSERDYSVRLPVGTPEISNLQTVTNRKDQGRKKRPGKGKDGPGRNEAHGKDAVEAEPTKEPADADEAPPAEDGQRKTGPAGGVDYLA